MADARACAVQVWSHRAHSGAPIEPNVPGEAQIIALAEQGIQAFDMDLMFVDDTRELFAAHPVAMRSWLGLSGAMSHSDLQRAAAARDGHELLTASRLLALAMQYNLTLALDLKGGDSQPEQHAQHLLWLAQRIQSTPGLAERAWLYVESTDQARRLRRRMQRHEGSPLTYIKPIRDRGVTPPIGGGHLDCATSQIQQPDTALFARLGPSTKCANPALIHAAWASSRWTAADSLLVWVVDDAQALEALVRFGVRHVISNRPLHVRAIARSLCRRGQASNVGGGGGVERAINCAGRGSHTCTV